MDRFLEGKVAVVTGGASGIGRATAFQLARLGASVAVVDRDLLDADDMAEIAGNRSVRIRQWRIDLLETERLKGLVDEISAAMGSIDILVNCAGIFDGGNKLLELDERTWDRVFAINLKAPVILIHHVARQMVESGCEGRIVNVSSSSAFRARFSFPAYGASKAGINQLTRSAAAELGPFGINVNAVVPGITVTPMSSGGTGSSDPYVMAKEGPLANLLSRPSLPEDIADAIAFLCGPGSRQVTGQMIHVNGGSIV